MDENRPQSYFGPLQNLYLNNSIRDTLEDQARDASRIVSEPASEDEGDDGSLIFKRAESIVAKIESKITASNGRKKLLLRALK